MKTGSSLALLLALSLPSVFAQSRALVRLPVSDMHSQASLDSDVVSQARYGQTVEILKSEAGWARIKTPDAYEGWLPADRLVPLPAGPAALSAKTAWIESNTAHLYREPSVTKHRPLLTLPFETPLTVVEERPEEGGRWVAVRLVDGALAYVQRGDLRFDNKPRSVPELVELSKRFLGLPYTWGGTSAYGYDCSGFAQMLVRQGGVEMPRDAQPQADWPRNQVVERSALQPGDLLYFGSTAKKITHTGFYLGDGLFIHATTNTHPVLQISRLDDQPWTKLFVAARRWPRP